MPYFNRKRESCSSRLLQTLLGLLPVSRTTVTFQKAAAHASPIPPSMSALPIRFTQIPCLLPYGCRSEALHWPVLRSQQRHSRAHEFSLVQSWMSTFWQQVLHYSPPFSSSNTTWNLCQLFQLASGKQVDSSTHSFAVTKQWKSHTSTATLPKPALKNMAFMFASSKGLSLASE